MCYTKPILQPRRRAKRFDDAESEDIVNTGCEDGHIVTVIDDEKRCARCTAGTYANTGASPQVCTVCALDTYSGESATSCSKCAPGLGTLEKGSDNVKDCIGLYTVI
jgi:hypothetical protein